MPVNRNKKQSEKRKRMWMIGILAAGALLIARVFAYNHFAYKTDPIATDPIATITIADGGVIEVQLHPEIAPETVGNFISLANSGFYDGLTFHRVISGFMIQGGDPRGDGTGGPGYRIRGEFAQNGVDNPLAHTRGVLSMARSGAGFDTAGSQFFIMHGDAPYLDGGYAAFGTVIRGMDVVDRIAAASTNASDKPLEDVIMQSVRVETSGASYRFNKIEN
jgi:peptidyl-prolyl cis-trans isomerase B (cyclophilin B)